MGVYKDMRSSDSSRKAFVPKMREISAVAKIGRSPYRRFERDAGSP